MKQYKYVWYNALVDRIFELDFELTYQLVSMMITHELEFNKHMLYLGKI